MEEKPCYFITENRNYFSKRYSPPADLTAKLFLLKPLIQKLPLTEETSFVAKTFRTPHFEVPWHQHIEYELILFTEGNGMSFIGNYIGEFRTGDVFFIGSNVPHTFQKQQKKSIASAVVVQFRADFLGTRLFADTRRQGRAKFIGPFGDGP